MNDGGRNLRRWFFFTEGEVFASDIDCLLEHVKKFAERGGAEFRIKGYDDPSAVASRPRTD
jgi:hypothetical protein